MDFTVPRFERFKWPKIVPEIDAEQKALADDFMKRWHSVLPNKFGVIEKFNHGYPLHHLPEKDKFSTLEIGAGLGAHIEVEDLSKQEYHCIELRQNMADAITARFPSVLTTVGDCQKRIPYADQYFDRIVAVHVLEHLPDLPRAIDQMHRVLKPGGLLSIVIPCDPGLAYRVASRIAGEHMFRKWYKMPYRWLLRREHINSPREIIGLLNQRFSRVNRQYFPLPIPVTTINLCVGLTFRRD